jgi:hypothetical protein
MKELELEVELLKRKNEELLAKNRVLNEAVLFYADPLKEWDKGKIAQKAIKLLSKHYKPVNSEVALMFKEKEVYPFVEFEQYIPTEEEEYLDEEDDCW